MRRAFQQLAARPWLLALILFAAGVTFTSLRARGFNAPLPQIHDEFANLFLGETFARGRLTNPPPPGPPEFFETFHELITPRYISKFPPGQGIMLALGILLGNAIIGVWVVNGLWAVALYWMLRGAAPRGWAAAGALIGVLCYGALSYWGYSYWGGSMLALGGALAFGGALRLWRRRGSPIGAALGAGTGCAIMALTRPLDGFIFAVWPTLVIAAALWRDARTQGTSLGVKRGLAFALPALVGVGLMLGYNVATTGSPTKFAHRLYDETHVPNLVLFAWEVPPPIPPGTPQYLVDYQKKYADTLGANPLTLTQQMSNALDSATVQENFLFPLWMLPLVGLGVVTGLLAKDRAARLALGSLVFIVIPILILRFYQFPHYAAAWTSPALLLFVQGVRHLRAGGAGHSWRVPAVVAALAMALWPATELKYYFTHQLNVLLINMWASDRVLVEGELEKHSEKTGHKQLVAVTYPPKHVPHNEWVFNTPDPGEQTVLWARSLGADRDEQLFAAFPGYDYWRLETDQVGRLKRAELIQPKNPDGSSKPPLILQLQEIKQ